MIDQIAHKLGFTKMSDGSWFHPDTQKTVMVLEHTVVVTEDVSVENEAQAVHVMTCAAGKLEDSFLSNVNGEMSFSTDESIKVQFCVVLIHAPTMTIRVPLKFVDVKWSDYDENRFVHNMAERACKEAGVNHKYCEVEAVECGNNLYMVSVLSLSDAECPFPGIHAKQLLDMEPDDPRHKALISMVRSRLLPDPQQSSYTLEHELHRQVRSHDEYMKVAAVAPSTPSVQP